MNIIEMHYELDVRLNDIQSLNYNNLQIAEKDVYFNRGQIQLINNKYGINNTTTKGFESNQKRIEDLKTLLVKGYANPLIPTLIDSQKYIYRYDLNNLDKKYLYYISSMLTITKGACSLNVPLIITEHDDIYTSLLDDNYSPSFEWMYVPANFSEQYIYVYTNNEFSLGNLYLDYLRYPKKIYYGNYNDIDGNLLAQSDCELPEYLHYELLDVVELLIKMDSQNPTVNSTVMKNQMNE
jgi:hypothetical protein